MVVDPNALITSAITAEHCDSISFVVVIRCSFNEPSWSTNCTEYYSAAVRNHLRLVVSPSCCADPPDGFSLLLTVAYGIHLTVVVYHSMINLIIVFYFLAVSLNLSTSLVSHSTIAATSYFNL